MKRLISLLLSALLVLSCVSPLSLSALAETEENSLGIDRIAVSSDGTATEEYSDGEWDEEAGFYRYYTESIFSSHNTMITVYYTNGETTECDMSYGTEINGYPVSWTDNQSADHPWTPEGDNLITFEYCGFTATLAVPIKAIYSNAQEIAQDETKTAIFDGSSEYAVYRFVPEQDGRYTFTSMSDTDTYGYIANEYGRNLASDDDGGNGNNFAVRCNMAAGSTYYLKARYCNTENTGSFDVTVQYSGAAITGLTLLQDQPLEIYEYTGGNYDTTADGAEYFCYNCNPMSKGIALKISYSDNTETVYYADGNDFYTADGERFDYGYGFGWSNDQSVAPWTCGNTYSFGFYFSNFEEFPLTMEVTIVENPIESIEFIPTVPYQYYENQRGYWTEDNDGNAYFYYYWQPQLAGNRFIVHYYDGSEETYTYASRQIGDNEYHDAFYNENWEMIDFNYENNQYEHHWLPDADNYVTFHYMNRSVTVPVTVVTFNPDYGALTQNETTTVEVPSDAECYVSFTPQADAYYTFTLSDSNVYNGAYMDVSLYDSDENDLEVGAYSYHGEELVKYTLSAKLTQGITYSLHFRCSNANEENIRVSLLAEPMDTSLIESVSLSKASLDVIQNTSGWDDEAYGGYYYDPLSLLQNIRISIRYTDGRTSSAFVYNLTPYIDGFPVNITTNQTEEHPWLAGNEDNTVTFEYLGHTATLNVNILDVTYQEQDIALGESKQAVLNGNETADFRFTPEEDGEYTFYSVDADTSAPPRGEICDENGNLLTANTYGGPSGNFAASYVMTAGTQYLLKCRYTDENHYGVFTVSVKKTDYYAGKLTLGEPKKLKSVTDTVYYRFAFTPTETDTYVFKTEGTHLYTDIPQYLFENGERLAGHSNRNGHEYLTHTLTAGKTYLLTVSCNPGDDTSVVAEKLDNSHIQGISLLEDDKAVLYEGTNGYSCYDSATGQRYFRYDLYNFVNTASVAVHYTDGTTKAYGFDDLVDGHYSIQYTDNQSAENPWRTDSDNNIITCSVLGFSADRHVKVLPFPTYPGTQAIALHETKQAVLNGNETADFTFVPTEDGEYTFSSSGAYDTYGTVADETGAALASDDDSGNGSNFAVTWAMTAGETYYLQARLYSPNQNAVFNVTVTKAGEAPHQHSYSVQKVVAPTCTAQGYTVYICSCGDSYVDNYTAALGHEWKPWVRTAEPSCTATGKEERGCTRCTATQSRAVAALGHNYKKTVTKATLSKNGSIVTKCTRCKTVKSKTVIYRPKTFALAKTAYVYTGKVIKPAVTVKDSKGNKIAASNYTVKYEKNKAVGTATVTITFKGNYSGTKKLTFKINPKPTTLASVTAASKGFTVKWKKQATQTTGYQIQYSTTADFKKATTVTVTKNTTLSKKITKLTAKKKYYVRVRTYKKVGKTNYYSAWSAKKTVTTKK